MRLILLILIFFMYLLFIFFAFVFICASKEIPNLQGGRPTMIGQS